MFVEQNITVHSLKALFGLGQSDPSHYEHVMRAYAAFICDHGVDFVVDGGHFISEPEQFGSAVLCQQLEDDTVGAVAHTRSKHGVQLHAVMWASVEVYGQYVRVGQTPTYWLHEDLAGQIKDEVSLFLFQAATLQLLECSLRELPREHGAVRLDQSGAATYRLLWVAPSKVSELLVKGSRQGVEVEVISNRSNI